MRGKITKRRVDALKPARSQDVFLWDTELRGFGVRVKPSGVRSFLVAYYAPGLHRVRRRLTLGTFGALTVDQARKNATDVLARVSNDEDPALAIKEGRRAAKEETVEQLFAGYLEHARAHFKARSVEAYESMEKLYVRPALGSLPVAGLTTRDVAQLHHKLRSKPVAANRVVQMLRAFYYWLEKRQIFSGRNPTRGIEFYREAPRERFLTIEEMSRLGHALRTAETEGLLAAPEHKTDDKGKAREPKRERNAGMFTSEPQPANPFAVAAIRFLMFTGWREQEALTLRWVDVEPLSRATALLPNTKAGKSARPLGAPAVQLLDSLPRLDGSPYVFPGRDAKKPLESVHRLWTAVRHSAGLSEVRLHDLRHSVASVAGSHGYSLFLIGKLLGHKTAQSTERYAHVADDARKLMADTVAVTIESALNAVPTVKRA